MAFDFGIAAAFDFGMAIAFDFGMASAAGIVFAFAGPFPATGFAGIWVGFDFGGDFSVGASACNGNVSASELGGTKTLPLRGMAPSCVWLTGRLGGVLGKDTQS